MWLGMLSAAAAQVPGFPVQIVNAVDAPLLAYVAQVAAWCGRPSWAYVHLAPGLGGLIASYAGLAVLVVLVPMLARRHRSLVGGAAAALAVAALLLLVPGRGNAGQPVRGLRVEVLDVGQGDAILLQPARAPAVLVDGGPREDDLTEKLREAGVDRVGAAIVTHEQADHSGGIAELLGRLPVDRLVYGRIGRSLRREAEAAGATPVRIAAGGAIRSGSLRLEALWPPPALLAEPLAGADPNDQALVLLARWHDFSMLLTADAEAEAVPLDPGPVDVLKLAHHGSDDAGLSALLERTVPNLGVISVGSDNPYGHPTATTLATLAAHGVPTLRTDRDGTVTLEVRRGAVTVTTDR
jgi:competence protein ComEC